MKKNIILIVFLERFIEDGDIIESCFGWLRKMKIDVFKKNMLNFVCDIY